MKNAIIICNPVAGTPRSPLAARVRKAADLLREEGIEPAVAFTAGTGNARELAQEAVRSGRQLIIACGGDGTINEVINGMGPTDVPLAIFPAGTANIVGRELGLPASLNRAAKALPQWVPCRIALGRATWGKPEAPRQRYFLAVAGVGFDARVISKLDLASKLRVGVIAYAGSALRQVFEYDFPQFQCAVNGTKVSTTFAVIQRSLRYAGWLHLARSTGLRRQRLACCLFNSRSRARYFVYALAIVTRTHHRLGDVSLLEGEPVVCASEDSAGPIDFEVDGELVGQLPVRFDVVPDALTLLVPRSFLR